MLRRIASSDAGYFAVAVPVVLGAVALVTAVPLRPGAPGWAALVAVLAGLLLWTGQRLSCALRTRRARE